MNERDLSEFAYLWDPKNGWSLTRHFHEQSCVKILFEKPPTLEQLKNARALLPLIRELELKEFFTRFSKALEIDVGTMITRHALALDEECKKAGLKAVVMDKSHFSYLAVNETLSQALLIEDPEISKQVYERMVAEGVPVTDVIGD